MSAVLLHSESTPTGTKVVRNVVFGALRVFLVAPIPLLLTPFIIKKLGTQGLGLWALFLAFNGLTALADLGFLGTLTKHVSEHSAKQEYEQLNRVINAGLLIFVGAALVAVAAVNGASGLLVRMFFHNASVPAAQMQHAFQLLSIALGFNLMAFPFMSIITGLQQFGLSTLIATINNVAVAGLAAIFLAFSFGYSGLVYAIVLSAALNLVLYLTTAKQLVPRFHFSPGSVRWRDIRELCAFSVKIYVVQVAVVIHNHIEKFLLAYFSGLTATGLFDVANDLSLKSRGVPSLLLSPLLPAASELQARDEQAKTLQLYQRSQKYLATVGVVIILITALFAHRFVAIWLGPQFAPVAGALIVLTIMQLINLSTGPGFFIFTGKNNLNPSVYLAGMGIVINVILSTILIARFGFAGAVVGTAIAVSAASISFVSVFHKQMRYPASLVLGAYIKPLWCAAALAAAAVLVLPVSRLGWIGMISATTVITMAYFGGLLALHYFDEFDLRIAKQMLKVVPLLSSPARVAARILAIYSGPPLHRIVRKPFSYLCWRAGFRSDKPKTVRLRTGECIVMRHATDWFTAAEVFLKGEYAPPFEIPSDLRCIHDLGGNVGYAAIFLARRFPQSHVEVFEPHPEHLRQLDANLELNGLRPRVTVHPYAVGASCRELYLTDADTRSSLSDDAQGGAMVVKVADWFGLAQKREIDLVKIDIEGGEYEIIFDPRFDSLEIPYLFLEWHVPEGASRPDVAERLKSLGYEVHAGEERRLPDLRYGMIWARLQEVGARKDRAESFA